MLRVLGIAVIFLAMSTPINSILQAIGQEKAPVRFMIIGGAIKLIINFIFVAEPSINIQSAPYGTVACYTFIVIASVMCLKRSSKIKIDNMSVLDKTTVE